MTIQDVLFEGYAPIVTPDPLEPLSADVRRTVRQHQLVEAGTHPLTHGRARPDLGTCGDCVWRLSVNHHGRQYPKCGLPTAVGRQSHSATSDCRAWWPACDHHQSFEPGQIRCRQCDQVGPVHAGSKTICQSCKEKA